MKKLIEFLGRQPKSIVLAEGLLLVMLAGIFDYATGEELFFLEFYFIPVLIVTWHVSQEAGILICGASGVCWFIDDVVGRNLSGQPLMPYWNVALKFVVFLLFVLLISSLKRTLESKQKAEQEHVRHELEIAREVQQHLFPQVMPTLKTLDYRGICKPVFEVGGDYYDFLPLKPGMLGVALADVSGKGISSALLMSNLQAMIRSRAYQNGHRLDLLVQEINSLLFSSTHLTKYATLFYGVYEDDTQQLNYVNAGHNPPFLFRNHSNNQVEHLMPSGVVIGLFPNRTYEKVTVQLYPGDVLVLYTDGITEAVNEDGEEFGEQCLSAFIQRNLYLPASELAELLLQSVKDFAGHAPQHDDLTVVVLKVRIPA